MIMALGQAEITREISASPINASLETVIEATIAANCHITYVRKSSYAIERPWKLYRAFKSRVNVRWEETYYRSNDKILRLQFNAGQHVVIYTYLPMS